MKWITTEWLPLTSKTSKQLSDEYVTRAWFEHFGLYLHFAPYIFVANYYGLLTIFSSAVFHARMALFRLLSIWHSDDNSRWALFYFSMWFVYFSLHSIAFMFVCLFISGVNSMLHFYIFIFLRFSPPILLFLPNKCSSTIVDCVIASYLVYMYLCAFQCILSPPLVRNVRTYISHIAWRFSAFLYCYLGCVCPTHVISPHLLSLTRLHYLCLGHWQNLNTAEYDWKCNWIGKVWKASKWHSDTHCSYHQIRKW